MASKAGISKRTLYSRYPDKAALFGAVIESVIGGLRPAADVPLLAGDSLRERLGRLAGFILRAALAPAALALHRLIVAESARFPELAAAVAKQGATQQAVDLIAALLEGERHAGRPMWGDTRFAAEHFLYMVFVVPQRRAMGLGTAMTEAELDAWARDTVDLFLNGCAGRAIRDA